MENKYIEKNLLTVTDLESLFNHAVETGHGNEFFNRLNFTQELFSGNYSACINQGLSLLQFCKKVNPEGYKTIHKGTAYYWMAIAAFMMHDYQTAIYLIDASVSEDLRAGNDLTKLSPSMKFILLRGDLDGQAAQELVKYTQSELEEKLRDLNCCLLRSKRNGTFNLSDLQKKFLEKSLSKKYFYWKSLATTLLSFILEGSYRIRLIDIRLDAGSIEPFLIHLFKGCVLFESLLKANPRYPVKNNLCTLKNALYDLSEYLDISPNIKIGNSDFDKVLKDISEKNLPLNIEESILLTGKVRNSLGHYIAWNSNLSKENYLILFSAISNAILIAIRNLY